ncbi:hypothetical protein [Gilliamella sp. Pas-s25]|uniref:hypothetical protein n=1 Tax=Gilliamella sp. Pas-s25 TaxID=2687310 RepID=UPI00135EF941|nr:hypothetical protein [Gilliamella sp. Pas-s25]MWP63158.1 hypothetical protein [Gilliamella sp. Pas-s25]
MIKLSFFKLPFLFVLFYGVLDSTFLVGREFLVDNMVFSYTKLKPYIWADSFVSLIIHIVLPNTFNQLANLVLIFITSAIILHKNSVYRANKKNLLCVFLIVFLIIIGINGCQVIFERQVLGFLYSAIAPYYFPHIESLYIAIFRLACYIWIIMAIYFGVKLLRTAFVTESDMIVLSSDNSQKIHLSLFILLFNFYYLAIVLFCLNFFFIPKDPLDSTAPFEQNIVIITFYSAFLLIINMIGYFALRKKFMAVNGQLQVKSLIFSAAIAFMLTLLIAIIVISINIYCLKWFDKIANSLTNNEMLVIVIADIIFLFLILSVIGCGVVRKTAKAFFSKKDNLSCFVKLSPE